MALPSPIPTSFVPHSGSASTRLGISSDYTGAFAFIGYAIFFITVVAALAVFVYSRTLISEETVKNAAVVQAESNLDPSTVETFTRLRDRLSESETLLQTHTAFSNFFAALQTILPATVSFTSLHISLDSADNLQLSAVGTAEDFNSLAAFSNELSSDGHFTNVVFSGLSIDPKTGRVSFMVTATPDMSLIAFTSGSLASTTQAVVTSTATSTVTSTATSTLP